MNIKNPSDEELRELVYQFKETSFHSPYAPLPQFERIRLTNEQISELLALLGGTEEPEPRNYSRRQLVEAAEYYCDSLWHQETISPSVAAKKLSNVCSGARKLLNSFDDSSLQTRLYVQSFMRIAAEKYGHQVMSTTERRGWDIPWNFWTACRLPSAVQSVELLEHWAEMAKEMLQPDIGKSKRNRGKSAARVLIHRLALAWLHARRRPPGAGYDTINSKADGPFIRFASRFVELLRLNVPPSLRTQLPTIDHELSTLTPGAIRGHLRLFLKRLHKPKQ